MAEDWRQRLRRLMKLRQMTMKQLSLAAGQGETYVRDILERDRMPSIAGFAALAEALKVSLEHLWYGRAGDQ